MTALGSLLPTGTLLVLGCGLSWLNKWISFGISNRFCEQTAVDAMAKASS